jgi:uncharacterized protein involved in exopolysaccharide biosynthesis
VNSQFNSTFPASEAAPMQRPVRTSTLREALINLFYDRYRIGAVLLLGLVLTAVAALMAPKRYVAEASLLLRLGREYIYTPEIGDPSAGGAPVAYDREQTLQAETKILTSRDLKEDVLKKMGVENVFPKIAANQSDPDKRRAAAVLTFEKSLEAELLKGSNLMQISFAGDSPEIASKVLTQLIDSYLQRRSVIFSSANAASAEADFNARKKELEAAEAKLAEAKGERGIRAFSEEQTLLLAQRNTLEMRQTDIALALAQAGGRTSSLRGSLEGVSGEVTLFSETQRSEAVENGRKLLLDLKLKERDLSSRYVDDNPFVQDVRADIARTSEFVRDLQSSPSRVVRSGRSPSRDSVESDLLRTMADRQQARSGAAVLSSQRKLIDERLAEFAISERQLPALERDRRMAEASYDAAAKRLRDETALSELDRKRRSNVSLVQTPMPPLTAKSLQPIILLVGTFLSVCAALLTAFLCALWRDTFLTPEETERGLGLPVLATVSRGTP